MQACFAISKPKERTHRLCTIEDGWVERFGQDILISFKRVLARERLIQELKVDEPYPLSSLDAFSPDSFLEKVNNANRSRLICGNPTENLQTIATERHLKFGIDFGAGFSVGLFRSKRKSPLRPSHRAQAPVELLCLHLLVFCERGVCRSNDSQHRPFQEIVWHADARILR